MIIHVYALWVEPNWFTPIQIIQTIKWSVIWTSLKPLITQPLPFYWPYYSLESQGKEIKAKEHLEIRNTKNLLKSQCPTTIFHTTHQTSVKSMAPKPHEWTLEAKTNSPQVIGGQLKDDLQRPHAWPTYSTWVTGYNHSCGMCGSRARFSSTGFGG